MSASNFTACLDVTLGYEGGLNDNPHDPGGRTYRGVTQRVYDAYRLHAGLSRQDVLKMDKVELQDIYKHQFWDVLKGDDLPLGVDLATFDAGVNSGPSRSAKWLQSALGVVADGVVGLLTTKAAAGLTSTGRVTAIQRQCAARLSFVHGLGTFKVFGKGWTARIANVEAKAVKMTGAVQTELLAHATKATEKATDAVNTAQGSVAAGAVGTGGITLTHTSVWWLVALIAAVGVAVAIAMYKKHVHDVRADAYRAAALST